MSEELLDDEIRYTKFRKPVAIQVDKEEWEKICDELQRKATIGTFIFLAVGVVVSLFVGIIVLIAFFGVTIFLNMNVRKRFTHLRSLSNHTYTISANQIIHKHQGKTETIPFNKIKHMEIHNWGLELDTQRNRKMADKNADKGRVLIPKAVNEYGRVLATFKALKI